MKHIHVLSWVILVLFCQQAKSAATWTNEPAGSTPLFDWAFNQTQNGKGTGYIWDVYNSARIVSDPTALLSPSNVLQSTLAAGAGNGGAQIDYIAPGIYRELFVGLYWRTNSEFQGRIVGNKMFFIRGPNSNGLFGFGGGSLVNGQGPMLWGHNSSNYDNSHVCNYDLGLSCPPNISSGTLTVGSWHKLEAYIKSSATATSRDGIARWWINGVLAGNYTNLNYASEGLNEWVWSETWDACGGAANCELGQRNTAEWAHYLDHLYVSVPNCGPSGCAAPAYLVITSSLPPTRTGTPYTATLSADGGTKPYTWFLDKGRLPAGLSLSSNGVISGTPTCVGRNDFTIRVTDAGAPAITTTKSYSVIVSGTGTCPIAITNDAGARTEAKPFMAKAVSGKVTFNLPVTSGAQYRLGIYDPNGKKVYEHRSMGQMETSIAKVLKNGVYVAKFEQGSLTSALRFSVMN